MTSEFDRLFVVAISAVFTLYLVRCIAGALLMACAQLPTRWSATAQRWSMAVTPRLVRRVGALALALLGGAGLAAPAHATGVPDLDRAPNSSPAPVDSGSRQSSPTSSPRSSTQSAVATVRVAPGDSLWRLAEHQLSAAVGDSTQPVTPRRIDQQWRRWYRANHTTIGSNPNLIRTGTLLRVPRMNTPTATVSPQAMTEGSR